MTDPTQPGDTPSFEKRPDAPSFEKAPDAPPPPPAQPPGQYQQPPQQYQQPPQQYPAPGQYPPPPGNYPAAPAAPPGQPYGTGMNELGLPPGVELASVGRRIGAYFLAIPLAVVTLGIGYIIWGLILWSKGTTPALKVLGMRCWEIQNRKVPGWGRMFLRDFVGRIVDGILSIITGLISFIMFCTGAKRQALHDLVAGTTVVHDPNKVLG